MAGAKPQQQAAALGAIESAQPRADSHDCRGAGTAANSRATAGTAARAAQCSHRRNRAAGSPDEGAPGGGSTPDTTPRVKVAACIARRDTFFMAVPNKRGPLFLASLAVAFCAVALPARADEIRLKGGKKLYGVIVAYEDNMFKVKTDYGFVLVEKDKIASIVPVTPASGNAATPGAGLAKALDKKQSSDANITDLTASGERSDPTPAKPKFSNEPVRPAKPA